MSECNSKSVLAPCNHRVHHVQDEQPVPPLLADFRKMRMQMQQQGLFKCKKGYYLLKLASNFGLLATAVAVFALWRERMWAYVLSACLISLFWQQSGWLAHDFLHHPVFRSKRLNYLMGLLVGTVCLVSLAFLHLCICFYCTLYASKLQFQACFNLFTQTAGVQSSMVESQAQHAPCSSQRAGSRLQNPT